MPAAVTDAYASVATFRAVTGSNDRAQEAAIRRELVAAARYLDGKLGRFFTKDAAVVARYYDTPRAGLGRFDPDGESPYGGFDDPQAVLFVDDIATATGLIVKIDDDRDGSFADSTALTIGTDFVLTPENAQRGPEPRPYTAIRLTPYGAWGRWPAGCRVEVTAIYGWPAVPAPIETATIELVRLIRIQGPRATNVVNIGLENIEQVSPEARAIVEKLVRDYARFTL